MKTDSTAGLSTDRPANAAENAPTPSNGQRDGARLRDRLVVVCIFIVCAALTTLCYEQLGMTSENSAFAGLAILSALLGLVGMQAQGRRQAEIAALRETIQRLQSGAALVHTMPGEGSKDRLMEPASAPAPRAEAAPSAQSRSMSTVDAQMPGAIGAHPRWQDFDDRGAHASPGAGQHTPARPSPIKPPAAAASNSMPAKPLEAALDAALWPGTTLSTADPMRDQWAFRPRESIGAQPAAKPASGAKDALPMAPPTAGAAKVSAIDADLVHVQLKIKALAEEVNAAELTRQKPSSIDPQPGIAKTYSETLAATLASASPSASVTAAIDDSIGALKAAAASMSQPKTVTAPANAPLKTPAKLITSEPANLFGDLQIPASAQPIAVSAPSAAEPMDPEPDLAPVKHFWREAPRSDRASEIASAIEAGEMDVLLSPIVDLGSNGVTHYDLTFLIKTASGEKVESAEAELMLNGSAVLALFDRARLVRASVLAARLATRQKSGSLLSPVTGRSITNAEFLEEFARVFEEREGIASQLVLTFSQADIEQLTPAAWQALSDMHSFGFRFALDQIDHLSTDFRMLAKRGFGFAKLDAKALLNGVPSRERFVPADEVCRVLAGAGLALVASGLSDETLRAKIFGFGIIFGQGQLFGAPRAIDVQAPANPSKTAAA